MKITKNHYTNPNKHVVVFVSSEDYFKLTNEEIISKVKASKYWELAKQTALYLNVSNSGLCRKVLIAE